MNVLEGCRHREVEHLVYASSSIMYGLNAKRPFSVEGNVDHSVSLYAAAKKSNEFMAHSYSHLYNLLMTGRWFFRFMAFGADPIWLSTFSPRQYSKVARLMFTTMAIWNATSLTIDDIVEVVIRVSEKIPEADPKFDTVALIHVVASYLIDSPTSEIISPFGSWNSLQRWKKR